MLKDIRTGTMPNRHYPSWRLNVEVDAAAKGHLPIAMASPRHYLIEYKPWSLWYKDIKMSTNIRKDIYEIVHAYNAKTYWESARYTSREIVNLVDWEGIDTSMKEVPRHQNTFVTKHVAGMCGI
jgi:hypothetical protein